MVTSVTLSSGVTLQYADRGRASGMPLLFLHGATDSWRSFEPVLDRLPGTLRGLAITQRGHGHSSKPENGYCYVNFADDVVALKKIVWLTSGADGLNRKAAEGPAPLPTDTA